MDAMNSELWRTFFVTCTEVLGRGAFSAVQSDNWCAWTTFDRLKTDLHYWTSGLPLKEELGDKNIKDGGVWGQPFSYDSIAHIVIPKSFIWELWSDKEFKTGDKEQPIEYLSSLLTERGIPHRLTDLVLEIKCY